MQRQIQLQDGRRRFCSFRFAFFGLFGILTIVIKYLQLIVELVFKRKHYSFEGIEKIDEIGGNEMKALVGYTGFVGSNIYDAAGKEIDSRFIIRKI